MTFRIACLVAFTMLSCQIGEASLAIIGVVASGSTTNSTGDAFAWVPLEDMAAGEKIHFTDTGYFNAGNGGSGAWSTRPENTLTFTAPAGGIAAGTVQTVGGPLNSGGVPIDTNYSLPSISVYGTGLFALDPDDQLVAFRDSDLSDTAGFDPLYAVNFASNAFGGASTGSAGSTDLYPGLTEGVNAVAVGSGPGFFDDSDYARYVGGTTGTVEELLLAISDPANWDIEGIVPPTDPSSSWVSNGVTQFTLTSVPEPSSLLRGSMILAVLGLRNRRTAKDNREARPVDAA